MPLTREQKAELLKDLSDRFARAKSVSFSDYRGLTVNEMQELRRKLREQGVEYKITKKSLIRKACESAGIKEIPNEALEGPVGAAFAYDDEIAPFKGIATVAKQFDKLTLLGGVMNGALVSNKDASELSKLPSREELLAKLVGTMVAPIAGLQGTLSGVMRKFVATVEAVRVEKEKTAA